MPISIQIAGVTPFLAAHRKTVVATTALLAVLLAENIVLSAGALIAQAGHALPLLSLPVLDQAVSGALLHWAGRPSAPPAQLAGATVQVMAGLFDVATTYATTTLAGCLLLTPPRDPITVSVA